MQFTNISAMYSNDMYFDKHSDSVKKISFNKEPNSKSSDLPCRKRVGKLIIIKRNQDEEIK